MISEISETGLSFVSGHECAVGDELTVAWRMESMAEPFHVLGVVRHISEDGAGIEFLNISLVERRRLLGYLIGRPAIP